MLTIKSLPLPPVRSVEATSNAQTRLTAAVVLVGAEVVVLLVNGWVCPLTRLARRCSDDPDPAFDIDLPRWVVRRQPHDPGDPVRPGTPAQPDPQRPTLTLPNALSAGAPVR
jgi:hypothetical protein